MRTKIFRCEFNLQKFNRYVISLFLKIADICKFRLASTEHRHKLSDGVNGKLRIDVSVHATGIHCAVQKDAHNVRMHKRIRS